MWIIARRTSEWDDDVSPHPKAVRRPHGLLYRRDERNTDDPSKVPAYGGATAWWYQEGTNHRIEDGHIVRERVLEGDELLAWMLDIESLQELLDFNERLVIDSDYLTGLPVVEFYDTWRE